MTTRWSKIKFTQLWLYSANLYGCHVMAAMSGLFDTKNLADIYMILIEIDQNRARTSKCWNFLKTTKPFWISHILHIFYFLEKCSLRFFCWQPSMSSIIKTFSMFIKFSSDNQDILNLLLNGLINMGAERRVFMIRIG